MPSIRARCAAVLALCATAAASAAQQPQDRDSAQLQPFRAIYEVHLEGRHRGQGVLELERSGDSWIYSVRAQGTRGIARLAGFEAEQQTRFALVDGRMRPQQSSVRSAALLRQRQVLGHFDWDAGTVHWSGDVKPQRAGPVALLEGALTPPLLNLALARDVPGSAAGTQLHYTVVDRGRAEQVTYRVGNAEAVATALGEWHAVPASSTSSRRNRITTAWYAPEHPQTPVRILQLERGEEKYELRLLRVEAH